MMTAPQTLYLVLMILVLPLQQRPRPRVVGLVLVTVLQRTDRRRQDALLRSCKRLGYRQKDKPIVTELFSVQPC